MDPAGLGPTFARDAGARGARPAAVPRGAAGVMYRSDEPSMFGHVGDQLNGLESRIAGFELEPAHLSMDGAHMMNGGGMLGDSGSNSSLGTSDTLPGGGGAGGGGGGGGGSGGQNGATDMAIKVLVSNKDAGSLIGKNGSTIVSFQAATGSRVRVSRADEPFPGTQERVVLITGTLDCVSRCLALVIEQVHKHFADYPYADKEVQQLDPNAHRTMNLVVPAGASGLIIGRGGDTVRALASKSGSHIQLAGRERQIQGLSERLLCLTGSLASNVAASRYILEILHDDPCGKYDNVSTSYRGFATPLPLQAHQPLATVAAAPIAHHRTAQSPHFAPHRANTVRGRRDAGVGGHSSAGGIAFAGQPSPGDGLSFFAGHDGYSHPQFNQSGFADGLTGKRGRGSRTCVYCVWLHPCI